MCDEFTALLLLGGFLPNQDCEHAVGVDLVTQIFLFSWITSILMQINSTWIKACDKSAVVMNAALCKAVYLVP